MNTMIVKKLRIQQGWSQEQLAQVSGLSVRTIQRVEKGQNIGIESLKSLAAVFDVHLNDLQPETPMREKNNTSNQTALPSNTHQHEPHGQSDSLILSRVAVTEDEQEAFEYVRRLKAFYINGMTYIVVILGLTLLNFFTSPEYYWVIWPALGWGLGLAIQGINVFHFGGLFGPKWEREQIEKKLGRKL